MTLAPTIVQRSNMWWQCFFRMIHVKSCMKINNHVCIKCIGNKFGSSRFFSIRSLVPQILLISTSFSNIYPVERFHANVSTIPPWGDSKWPHLSIPELYIKMIVESANILFFRYLSHFKNLKWVLFQRPYIGCTCRVWYNFNFAADSKKFKFSYWWY